MSSGMNLRLLVFIFVFVLESLVNGVTAGVTTTGGCLMVILGGFGNGPKYFNTYSTLQKGCFALILKTL